MISDNSIDRRNHFTELSKYMPYKDKIFFSKIRIKEFFLWLEQNNYKEVSISFSGGKDSTVLFDLVNSVHKEIKSKIYIVPKYAMEITFPTTLKFIKERITYYQKKNKYIKDLFLHCPRLAWNNILKEKGFPIFSKQIATMINRVKRTNTKTGLSRWMFGMEDSAKFKISKSRLFLLDNDLLNKWNEIDHKNFNHFFSEKCCEYVKGGLKHDTMPSFVGTLADESELRKNSWIKNGCNILNNKKALSRPLSLWNTKDIWNYIKDNKLKINPAYNFDDKKKLDNQNLHFSRLGCTACPFGSHIEELKYKKVAIKEENIKKEFQLPKNLKFWNRYEILNEYYPNIYKSQVYSTMIYRILVDMNITIKNDSQYIEIYIKRRKQIDDWYNNIFENFLKILFEIELYKDNKKVQYNFIEVNKALDYFKIDGYKFNSDLELDKKRQEYKLTKNSIHKI